MSVRKGGRQFMQKSLVSRGLVIGIMLLLVSVGAVSVISGKNKSITSYQEDQHQSLGDISINYEDLSNDVEYYALIIGVEKFEGIELPGPYIDDSAIDMYEKLLSSNNWNEENIKLLLNENATKAGIQDAITLWLDDKETENDVVLYYFTGHSWKTPFPDRFKGHTYTYPYDYLNDNKITDVELGSWFDELESEHISIILDTCYSGRMTALNKDGRTVLAAGGKFLFCPVDGDDSLESGIFTYHLLQGFDGVADINNDGWVSAKEVFHYARMPTFHFSFWQKFPFINFSRDYNLPIFIGPQLPYIYDNHVGDILLINGSFTTNILINENERIFYRGN